MRAILVGVRSAWRTPRAIDHLDALTRSSGQQGAAAPDQRALIAMRWAQRTLAVLARLPGGRWRTTCLYRSVAECLALRTMGVKARITLAVVQEAASRPSLGVIAHAWVEGENGVTLGSAQANGEMTPFRRPEEAA